MDLMDVRAPDWLAGVTPGSRATVQQQQWRFPFQSVTMPKLFRGGICFWFTCGTPCGDVESFRSHLLEAHNSLQQTSVQLAAQHRLVELETQRLSAMKWHYETLCQDRSAEVLEEVSSNRIGIYDRAGHHRESLAEVTPVSTVPNWSGVFNDEPYQQDVRTNVVDAAIQHLLSAVNSSVPTIATHESVSLTVVSAPAGSAPASRASSYSGGGGGDDGFAVGSDSSDSEAASCSPSPSRKVQRLAARQSLRSRSSGPVTQIHDSSNDGSSSAPSGSESDYATSVHDDPSPKKATLRTPQVDNSLPTQPPVSLSTLDSSDDSNCNSDSDFAPPNSPASLAIGSQQKDHQNERTTSDENRKQRGSSGTPKKTYPSYERRKEESQKAAIKKKKKNTAKYFKISDDLVTNREFYKTSLDPPPYPIRVLIRQSIVESKDKRLSSSDILKWVQNNFGYYRGLQFHNWKGVHKRVQKDKCFVKCAPAVGNSAVLWTVDEKIFRETKFRPKSLHMNQMLRHKLSLLGEDGNPRVDETTVARPPSHKLPVHVPTSKTKSKLAAAKDSEAQKKLQRQVTEDLAKDLEENGELYKESDLRPPFTKRVLIKYMIDTSPKKELTLTEMCDWLAKTFRFFKDQPYLTKTSIKTTLHQEKAFLKSNVKGGPWKVNADLFPMINNYMVLRTASSKKLRKK